MYRRQGSAQPAKGRPRNLDNAVNKFNRDVHEHPEIIEKLKDRCIPAVDALEAARSQNRGLHYDQDLSAAFHQALAECIAERKATEAAEKKLKQEALKSERRR